MAELLLAAAHGLVGNKPCIAPAATVRDVLPPHDIALVRKRHTRIQPLHRHVPRLGQMEHMLMIAIDETRRVQRLEMPVSDLTHRNRLDPGDVVLQHEQLAQSRHQFKRHPRL